MIIELILLGAAAFMGIYVQTIAGFGFIFFMSPALLVYFNPPEAITTALLVASILSLLILFAEHRKREFSWPIILSTLLAAIPGLIIGSWIVTHMNKGTLQILVGVIIITSVIIQEGFKLKTNKPLKPSPLSLIIGFIAGVLNTSASMSGPPLVLWLRSRKVSRNQMRDTLAVCYIGLNIFGIGAIYFFKHSSLNSHGTLIFLLLIPVVLLGHRIGKWALGTINAKNYNAIILFLIFGAGIASIALGVFNL